MPINRVKLSDQMKKVLRALRRKDPTISVLQRETGDVKDSYSLGRELGRGLLGTTFRCTEKATGREYACKSILKRDLINHKDVEAVRRQVHVMQHLAGQPNIVSIKEAYEDSQAVHIVMELCEGDSLFDRIILQGHYTERKAAEIIRAVVGAVETCHSFGVMHRDIKPENFLFVSNEEYLSVKLISFASSVFFKPGQTFSDPIGEAFYVLPGSYYVAPDVLGRHYGPEVDVWSAGVILYMLLCGFPPRWGASAQGTFKEVLQGDIDFSSHPWPSISKGAKDLVSRMLNRDPMSRLTPHEVLCHTWIQADGAASYKPIRSSVMNKRKKMAYRAHGAAILNRLKQFSAMNRLKKMASRVIAERLSEEEIDGLKEMFKMMDRDDGGQITLEDLRAGLKWMGGNLVDSEVLKLMQAVDMDSSGTIDYCEFIAATLDLNEIDKEIYKEYPLHAAFRRDDRLYAAFKYFDMDGSGYITKDELERACEEFGIESAGLQEMIKEIDLDKDGQISFNDFAVMMEQGNP